MNMELSVRNQNISQKDFDDPALETAAISIPWVTFLYKHHHNAQVWE